MAETKVQTSEKVCGTTKVTTRAENDVTETQTDNTSKTISETVTISSDEVDTLHAKCPCGNFDLDKLAEESRQCAFKSSNIVAATSNSIVVFTLLILQEILKKQCHTKNLNIDNVFLITSAIATLGDGIQINNPPPFNS